MPAGGLASTAGREPAAQGVGARSHRRRCPHADHESTGRQPGQQGVGARRGMHGRAGWLGARSPARAQGSAGRI